MTCRAAALRLLAVLALAVGLAGCATRAMLAPDEAAQARPTPGSVLQSIPLDAAQEDRILALDPERVSEADVRDTLSHGPAPRIILMHGGIYPVHLAMASFGRFLARWATRRRRSATRRTAAGRTARTKAARMAPAWSRGTTSTTACRPMIVGHSQGGIQAVKILHELNGSFDAEVHPYDPQAHRLDRRRRSSIR